MDNSKDNKTVQDNPGKNLIDINKSSKSKDEEFLKIFKEIKLNINGVMCKLESIDARLNSVETEFANFHEKEVSVKY